jgi:tetratricopeptide (TPR) repeat protein
MTRMGWPYFVVSLLCMVFYVSEANMQAAIASVMPLWLADVFADLVSHYVIIATFHLMGYLMYQYHEKIGWEIEERVELQRAADPYQQLLDQAETMAREGKHAEAEELLRAEIFSRGASIAVHERYRKLLALRGDAAQSTKHGRDFINVLLAQDQDRKAIEVYRECLTADPAFVPAQAEHIGRLAQKAADSGNAQLALRMLSGFHRHFPKHKDIPKNYLLAAKLLAEKMNQEAPAKALLEQVRTQFPGHPLLPEVEGYAKFLDNLMGSAPRKSG